MTDERKDDVIKKVLRLHRSSEMHWVGNGFPVRSVFNYNDFGTELSPFLLLDYAVPYKFSPGRERRGVSGHPHKGFETVTIAYQGELEHRDSTGSGGKIGPGDVQWMTAGNGIIHQEFHSDRFTRKGGTLEMAQLWVNLRAKDKTAKPHYQTLFKAQIPNVTLPQGAGTVRIIAGEFRGRKGAAKTFTPINVWDVDLRGNKSAELPLPDGHTTTFFVLSGEVVVNSQREASEADLVIFDRTGNSITVEARTNAKLLLMDGEPMNEPIVGHGPFVMNSPAEIEQAFNDYQLGRMGELD